MQPESRPGVRVVQDAAADTQYREAILDNLFQEGRSVTIGGNLLLQLPDGRRVGLPSDGAAKRLATNVAKIFLRRR